MLFLKKTEEHLWKAHNSFNLYQVSTFPLNVCLQRSTVRCMMKFIGYEFFSDLRGRTVNKQNHRERELKKEMGEGWHSTETVHFLNEVSIVFELLMLPL